MPTELPEGEIQPPRNATPEKAVQAASSRSIRQRIFGFLKSYKTEVDVFNKLLQICALFVAAWWTWSVWNRTTAPGLESKLNIHAEVHWSAVPDNDLCQASLDVEIKNDGQRSFEVQYITLMAWMMDLKSFPPPSAGQPTFIVPKFVQSKGTSVTIPEPAEPVNTDLYGHYPPGSSRHSAVDVIFRKSPNSIFVFDATAYGNESRGFLPFTSGPEIKRDAWSLDQVCHIPKEKPDAVPASPQPH
jgi:hypothetical protein